MSAKILDGIVLAKKLKEDLTKDILGLKNITGTVPKMVSIVIGNDPASLSYVTSQQKTAQSLGINYELKVFNQDVSKEEVIDFIHKANEDKQINGIMVNKPVPVPINFYSLIDAIASEKDIEGMNSSNLGKLLMNKCRLLPCTPASALTLLQSSGVSLQGKAAVVVGRSEVVGKPMALLLLQQDMTVTVCHSKTVDLSEHLRRADVVVACLGQKQFIQAAWIKPGSIIIDVGIHQDSGRIVGDVDFDSCKNKASYITPVPGGVGPVTSVMLMKNALEAFRQSL